MGELGATPSERALDLLYAEDSPVGVDEGVWREWRSRFRTHLDCYGHTVYNLDFMNPVRVDDPAPLFDTLKFYLQGEGQNPHEHQRRTATRREEATRAVLERLDAPRRKLFSRLLKWAQDVAPVREDVLADVGLAHHAADAPRARPPPGRGGRHGEARRRVLTTPGRGREDGRVPGRGRDTTR